jgi:hypothetical protein
MSTRRTTIIFEKGGEEHTVDTLRIALEGAKERKIDTVLISTSTGETGLQAVEVFKAPDGLPVERKADDAR